MFWGGGRVRRLLEMVVLLLLSFKPEAFGMMQGGGTRVDPRSSASVLGERWESAPDSRRRAGWFCASCPCVAATVLAVALLAGDSADATVESLVSTWRMLKEVLDGLEV